MDKIAKKFSMQRKVGLSENQPKKHKNAVYSKSSTFTNLGDECTHQYHKKTLFTVGGFHVSKSLFYSHVKNNLEIPISRLN